MSLIQFLQCSAVRGREIKFIRFAVLALTTLTLFSAWTNGRLVSSYRHCKSGEVFRPDMVLDMHRAKTFERSQRGCAPAKTSNHHFHCHCTPLCTEAIAFAARYDRQASTANISRLFGHTPQTSSHQATQPFQLTAA